MGDVDRGTPHGRKFQLQWTLLALVPLVCGSPHICVPSETALPSINEALNGFVLQLPPVSQPTFSASALRARGLCLNNVQPSFDSKSGTLGLLLSSFSAEIDGGFLVKLKLPVVHTSVDVRGNFSIYLKTADLGLALELLEPVRGVPSSARVGSCTGELKKHVEVVLQLKDFPFPKLASWVVEKITNLVIDTVAPEVETTVCAKLNQTVVARLSPLLANLSEAVQPYLRPPSPLPLPAIPAARRPSLLGWSTARAVAFFAKAQQLLLPGLANSLLPAELPLDLSGRGIVVPLGRIGRLNYSVALNGLNVKGLDGFRRLALLMPEDLLGELRARGGNSLSNFTLLSDVVLATLTLGANFTLLPSPEDQEEAGGSDDGGATLLAAVLSSWTQGWNVLEVGVNEAGVQLGALLLAEQQTLKRVRLDQLLEPGCSVTPFSNASCLTNFTLNSTVTDESLSLVGGPALPVDVERLLNSFLKVGDETVWRLLSAVLTGFLNEKLPLLLNKVLLTLNEIAVDDDCPDPQPESAPNLFDWSQSRTVKSLSKLAGEYGGTLINMLADLLTDSTGTFEVPCLFKNLKLGNDLVLNVTKFKLRRIDSFFNVSALGTHLSDPRKLSATFGVGGVDRAAGTSEDAAHKDLVLFAEVESIRKVSGGPKLNNVTIEIVTREMNVGFDLHAELDTRRIGRIQLGTLLDANLTDPCVLSLMRSLRVERLTGNVGSLGLRLHCGHCDDPDLQSISNELDNSTIYDLAKVAITSAMNGKILPLGTMLVSDVVNLGLERRINAAEAACTGKTPASLSSRSRLPPLLLLSAASPKPASGAAIHEL